MKVLIICTVFMTAVISVTHSRISMFEKQADEYFEHWQDEADCRFALEMYIRRQSGELPPKSVYDMCDLLPLHENCSCKKVFDKRGK
jgi:hypothetical protein